MHPIQEAILKLAERRNLGKMTLRKIGLEATGTEQAPQRIKYHFEKLVKAKLLRHDKQRELVERIAPGQTRSGFVAIPILGSANCGPAKILAQENFEGHLCLSEKFDYRNRKGLFAIRAVGSSMNRARISGKKSIDDGDYVIIDGKVRAPDNGDYVLSVIGGMANIKKYVEDKKHEQIALVSESTEVIPPFFIHPDDDLDFFINGRVVDVFKTSTTNK